MIYDALISPLFIQRIKIAVDRSLFNNDKAMNVWGLKKRQNRGKTCYFDKTYDVCEMHDKFDQL